ncbi:MAG: bis(5'-nucleosyl)-tetraphosphatase (symmetrical) YqeK, partial [Coriobacteriia bacterium]|nr:bis(5'-nucleosyl)-tetraphosphatase (symmetrical) YqeK [Coriobacteriia bacterium]
KRRRMSFLDNQQDFDLLVARIKEQLEAREDEYGYRHSLGCAQCTAQMAVVYGLDEPRAYLAGLLHDWDRCVPKPELIEEARAMGYDITPEVLAAPAILHAHTGAAAVAAQFPEVASQTPEIITAIEHHTVGVPDMAPLDMLLYIADMIEPTRLSPNIADLREMVGTVDLDTLFMQAYQRSMAHLVRRRKVMHPDTIRVWNALVMRGEIGQDVVFPDPATITPALRELDPGEIPPELRGTWRNTLLSDVSPVILREVAESSQECGTLDPATDVRDDVEGESSALTSDR